MRVLVIGGSVFVGRAAVDEALAMGADVTVFNRGRSGPTLPGVTHIVGDRTSAADLAHLDGLNFDVVVDTCGYVPSIVAMSADLLAPKSGHYAFVSSINAYPGWSADSDYRARGVHDGTPDATEAPDGLDMGAAYGWLKTGCERAVLRAFGDDRAAVLRGGCIVGPNDSLVGRLPWWSDRVARGGDVLVPGEPSDVVTLIDARDLAQFALSGAAGVFDVTGAAGRDTRADLMAACAAATGTDGDLVYVPSDWLAAQDVQAWTEVPLWAPPAEAPSLFGTDSSDAEAAGLKVRPLTETVTDTWQWQQGVDGGWHPTERTPGLAPEREAELLAAWRTTA